MARKKLGAMLEEKGLINEFQLVAALSHQRKWKIRLGKALLERGFIDERKLFEVLAEQWEMELVDLDKVEITDAVKKRLARDKGMALMAMPVRTEGDTLVVAVSEPDRPDIKSELEKITGSPVKLVMAMDSQIEEMTRTLPEKIPVGSVKPVKKAFRKNDVGDMELVETEGEAGDVLLGGKEIVEKQAEAPIALGDEPVVLDEEISKSAELPVDSGALDVGIPELGKESPEIRAEEKTKAEMESDETKKEAVGEDTDELWENAQAVPSVEKPAESIETHADVPTIELPAEKEPLEESPEKEPLEKKEIVEPASMSEFYPGQMREIESVPEVPTEPKPEQEVVELSKEALLGQEKIAEQDLTEREKVISEGFSPPEIEKSVEKTEAEPEPKPSVGDLIAEKLKEPMTEEKKESPIPIAQQVESLKVEDELSKPAISELEKKEILQMVIEIDNRLKRLREMVKELKDKLES